MLVITYQIPLLLVVLKELYNYMCVLHMYLRLNTSYVKLKIQHPSEVIEEDFH